MIMENELSPRLITLRDGRQGIRGGMHVEIREPDAGSTSTLDFISSDETLDRYNEIISASGWNLENYNRNPIFQNAHQYGDIIFTIGKALSTEVRSGKLIQRIQFACDANPIAKIAYGLYRGKFLNAVSVGFVPSSFWPLQYSNPLEEPRHDEQLFRLLCGTKFQVDDETHVPEDRVQLS